MTEPKFTPGPYVSDDLGVVRTDSGYEVCNTLNSPISKDTEANAHLIAAAPELYDVVASLFELPDDADGGYICEVWEQMQGKAEDALKKARGEV